MSRLHGESNGIKRLQYFLAGLTGMLLVGVLILARSDAAAQSRDSVAQKAAGAPAGKAENGKTIYMKIGCWECHGRDAQSGRPALGPPALPFSAFMNQLRSPREDMPPYTAKVLSDADVADIYAFVQTLPQPAKADSIQLLKQ
jgi:mono/diheme cytochrome c family protein